MSSEKAVEGEVAGEEKKEDDKPAVNAKEGAEGSKSESK